MYKIITFSRNIITTNYVLHHIGGILIVVLLRERMTPVTTFAHILLAAQLLHPKVRCLANTLLHKPPQQALHSI